MLAVFPETTSFYRSIVVKTPKPPANPNANWDVVVRFEDDEDESGNTSHMITILSTQPIHLYTQKSGLLSAVLTIVHVVSHLLSHPMNL